VPVGDFFIDQANGASSPFESKLFAKRPIGSWYTFAPMPYAVSIRIELVNSLSSSVVGYTYVYHDNTLFDPVADSYFHAYYAPNSLLAFPWQPAPLLPPEGVAGPGHVVGTAMVFTSQEPAKFSGNFDHVCEGNYELFVDNTTVRLRHRCRRRHPHSPPLLPPSSQSSSLPPPPPPPLLRHLRCLHSLLQKPILFSTRTTSTTLLIAIDLWHYQHHHLRRATPAIPRWCTATTRQQITDALDIKHRITSLLFSARKTTSVIRLGGLGMKWLLARRECT
jgi:hypothetical protein